MWSLECSIGGILVRVEGRMGGVLTNVGTRMSCACGLFSCGTRRSLTSVGCRMGALLTSVGTGMNHLQGAMPRRVSRILYGMELRVEARDPSVLEAAAGVQDGIQHGRNSSIRRTTSDRPEWFSSSGRKDAPEIAAWLPAIGEDAIDLEISYQTWSRLGLSNGADPCGEERDPKPSRPAPSTSLKSEFHGISLP